MHNYFYNPCTAYCASSTPKNNRVGVTTLIYFMRWTYIINQYNHYKNNFDLYGCSFAQRCILKKQSRNRTKTRKNMFFLILFGFYHVFLTGRTAAKNNIQFQPYWSKWFVVPLVCAKRAITHISVRIRTFYSAFYFILKWSIVW